MGLENIRKNFVKLGSFRRPETAADILSMPYIKVAKPRKIRPVSFDLSFLLNISLMVPISARTGVKEEGFSSWINRLLLEMPARLKIQAVTVVPMLAPIIIWMACRRVISPELTKPTTITVVAEEL